MKKSLSDILLSLLLLSAASLLLSCSGVDMPAVGLAVDYPVTLLTSSPDSKISHEGTKMTWEEDDVLHLTAVAEDKTTGETSIAFYSYLNENNKSAASFSGFVTMTSAPDYCCFVYPKYSFSTLDPETGKLVLNYATQTGAHEPVMYARAAYSESGINQDLVHVGAILEIDVQMDDVAQISFVGNGLEQISPVSIDTQGGVKVGSESGANLQITVPVQSEGKTYIAVPPVNLTKGFSLICSNEDASVSMIKTFSTDGGLSSGYDFSSKVGQIIPVTLTGELENYSITASGLEVEHTKVNNLLTGTSVKFKMNKTGASDKIIEEWGAKLIKKRNTLDPESKDIVVRTVSYTNATPISSQNVIEMSKVDNWHLLPEGEYTFAPYYKIYGQTIALDSQDITVSDPGIALAIEGQTSYDKYLADNIDGANDHANNLIENVKVTTNVDLSIITEYVATLGGSDMGAATITSGNSSVVASYGNLTRASFASYPMVATLKVGEIAVTTERTFHLTGLPYEADFTTGNPTGWTPGWKLLGNAKYSSSRVTLTSGNVGSAVTPGFLLPQQLNVKTYVDACGAHTQSQNRTFHISTCAATVTTPSNQGSELIAQYKVSYQSTGYNECSTVFTLNDSASSLMYSVNPTLYNVALFKVKIEYSE